MMANLVQALALCSLSCLPIANWRSKWLTKTDPDPKIASKRCQKVVFTLPICLPQTKSRNNSLNSLKVLINNQTNKMVWLFTKQPVNIPNIVKFVKTNSFRTMIERNMCLKKRNINNDWSFLRARYSSRLELNYFAICGWLYFG